MFQAAERVVLSAVLTLVLVGCQTQAQQQISQSDEVFKAANESRAACLAPVKANPSYELIRRRWAKPPSPLARPALERLGDPDKASDAEIRLLREIFDIQSRCDEAYAAAIAPVSPDHASLSRQTLADMTQITLRLIRREITWGEGNQQEDALYAQGAERERRIATARWQGLQAQHNAEMAHRQQTALFMQQQQMMQQQRQPMEPIRFGPRSVTNTNPPKD